MALVGLGVLAQDFLLGAEAEAAVLDAGLAASGTGLSNLFQGATLPAAKKTDPPVPVLPLRGGDYPVLRPFAGRDPPPDPPARIVNEGFVVVAVGAILAFSS